MSADLVDRLAALPVLKEIPRQELEWLVAHGSFEQRPAGKIMAPKGKRIDTLWILLAGKISVSVDRGVGPRRVITWRTGEVTGMLPYSRMTAPPGDNFVEETSELLTIHERLFPEMVSQCPAFTAYTVHLMLDRARRFNASDLHDEKMLSLGKLAAGLAHELNNPASATVSAAQQLRTALAEADAASQAIGAAGLTAELRESIDRLRAFCLAERGGRILSPLERADREDVFASWLEAHRCDPDHARRLAETDVKVETLDELATMVPGETLEVVLRWIAAGCEIHALAVDIERSASRIHDLVAAVKRFTHMDSLAGSEAVDVEAGLRDTIRVIASKAKSKGASVTLDVEPGLPKVNANGGELNQVWLNLIDNALDAIGDSGHVAISARRELNRVVVSVVDDGGGIPPDVQPRIFDAFFTTKSPGKGLGLGLELTRRLVRRYQGDITVESRPGRTEFQVNLEVDRPATATSVAGDSQRY